MRYQLNATINGHDIEATNTPLKTAISGRHVLVAPSRNGNGVDFFITDMTTGNLLGQVHWGTNAPGLVLKTQADDRYRPAGPSLAVAVEAIINVADQLAEGEPLPPAVSSLVDTASFLLPRGHGFLPWLSGPDRAAALRVRDRLAPASPGRRPHLTHPRPAADHGPPDAAHTPQTFQGDTMQTTLAFGQSPDFMPIWARLQLIDCGIPFVRVTHFVSGRNGQTISVALLDGETVFLENTSRSNGDHHQIARQDREYWNERDYLSEND